MAAALSAAALLTAGCGGDAAATPASDTPVQAVPEEPVVPAYATEVDWTALAYETAGCYSLDMWLAEGWSAETWGAGTEVIYAEVTGDRISDVLVRLTCPAPTSTRPNKVVAYDVSGATPALLGVLGDELFFPRATVTTAGTSVTLTGPTIAGSDALCCPEHWGTVVHVWDGARFVVEEREEALTSRPIERGRLDDGEHVGMLRAVGADTIYIDLVEFLEGEEALAACRAESGQENPAGCFAYVRDPDDVVVVVPVSPSAPISYIDFNTLQTVTVGDVIELEGTTAIADPEAYTWTRFTTHGGLVTSMEGYYTP